LKKMPGSILWLRFSAILKFFLCKKNWRFGIFSAFVNGCNLSQKFKSTTLVPGVTLGSHLYIHKFLPMFIFLNACKYDWTQTLTFPLKWQY
jgi:hypothetical protein